MARGFTQCQPVKALKKSYPTTVDNTYYKVD